MSRTLDPRINRAPWTEQEEATIVAMQAQYGNSWARIAEKLSGRTDSAIKNHWNSYLKQIN
uniref:Uncharacterized protein n=1 Tax=Globisporangium ultimum (strain ATCC 200006 / CBS 805.95 / DAOM BR144) TaxID=431595 RepID=K3X4Y9_GLOUD